MRVQDLPTPALLLDSELFEANLRRMVEDVAGAGKVLRPHAKAHKCAAIAQRQMKLGASGVCVATVAEAEVMARAGIADILLTSPIADAAKCARMAALAQWLPQVSVVVDHYDQALLYGKAAHTVGTTLNVFVDLDIGDHRTGISPGTPALALAKAVEDQAGLTFGGLQAYSVRASHMSASDGVAEFTASALNQAAETKSLLEANGIPTATITGGSTGSYAADAELPFMSELQAGSYALMDVAYARIGLTRFGHALSVLATVVSVNSPDRITVDAGFKAFSTDRAFGPDLKVLTGARYQWAGDEFGFVFLEDERSRPKLGDKIEFLPPHCDPTVNLYDRIYVHSGDIVQDVWSVMDRYHAE